MDEARPPPRIAHIALKVADIERAARFYEEVFGFRRTDTRTERGRTSCHLTDGAVDLAMVEFHEGADEIGRAAGDEPCIHHFGIDVDEIEAYAEKLARAGAEIVDDPGGRTLKFRAPGGGGLTEIAPAGWHARRTGSRSGTVRDPPARSPMPRTLFDKIWDHHAVAKTEDGDTLLYVDRCLIHEGSRHAFDRMELDGHGVARPGQVFAFADHYVPTANRHLGIEGAGDPLVRGMIERLARNAERHGIRHFGIDDPHQGILHVVPPELGLTQPGILMVGADSHTSTHGAFGALAFGIGASETRHVLVTRTLWQRRPRNLRIRVDGTLPFGCTAKDLILAVISRIGSGGAVGHAIEYTGPAIRALSMEGRMTICNMSIEAGARAGLIAPDDTTIEYLAGRPFAPQAGDWDAALAFWRSLPSDPDAEPDGEVALDAPAVAPMVTWGTSPEHADLVTGTVPDPAGAGSAERRADLEAALDYMGLEPGRTLTSIGVDRVFIGSCTNGRIEDLREAAEVARRGAARVPAWVVPGSREVKRQAEAEGLDEVFRAAGFEWRDPGCSLCTAINGDELRPGERCASTSNRNFRGRQGRGGRTHLMSPAMAAAAALTGRLTDVRRLAPGRD